MTLKQSIPGPYQPITSNGTVTIPWWSFFDSVKGGGSVPTPGQPFVDPKTGTLTTAWLSFFETSYRTLYPTRKNGVPAVGQPVIDPKSGNVTIAWWSFFNTLLNGT